MPRNAWTTSTLTSQKCLLPVNTSDFLLDSEPHICCERRRALCCREHSIIKNARLVPAGATLGYDPLLPIRAAQRDRAIHAGRVRVERACIERYRRLRRRRQRGISSSAPPRRGRTQNNCRCAHEAQTCHAVYIEKSSLKAGLQMRDVRRAAIRRLGDRPHRKPSARRE